MKKRKSTLIICKTIGINLLFLFGMLLVFEPVWPVDNAIITSFLYGGYGSEFESHAIYTTFPYASFVVFLLKTFPGLPWFSVLDIIWLFIAFTLLTYLIYEKYDNSLGTIINSILLTFFTYEGYVCQQFTKTSVFLIAIGVFVVLAARKRVTLIGIGMFLVVIGSFIRAGNTKDLVIGAWLILFLAKGLWEFLFEKKDEWRQTIVYVGVVLGIWVICFVSNEISSIISNVSEEWEEYQTWTGYRSLMLDYDLPDYEDYADEYEKIGVSENDLKVWRGWNRDTQEMSIEVMQDIDSLRERIEGGRLSKIFDLSNVNAFFKEFPFALLTIDTFYAFLLLAILFILGAKLSLYKTWGILVISVTYLLLNYYLFVGGRYLVHRVDVGISFVMCLMLIFWMKKTEELKFEKIKLQLIVIVFSLLMCVPYKNYKDDKLQVSKEQQTQNYDFYSQTSRDKEHYYTLVSGKKGQYELWGSFGAWDCMPMGFFENVYGTVDPSPEIMENVSSYGIENPFLDVINSEIVYLVFAENNTMQDVYELYVEEHTQEEIELVVVKEYHNKRICRVVSSGLKEIYDFKNVDNVDGITGTCTVKFKNQSLALSGNMHLEGKNGFAQNTYLEIKDAQTEEYELYYVKQEEDKDYKKTDENYYSKLSAEIEVPNFYDEEDEVYIIIEYKGEVYRQKLEV